MNNKYIEASISENDPNAAYANLFLLHLQYNE